MLSNKDKRIKHGSRHDMSGQRRYSTVGGLVGEGSSEKVTGAKGRAASRAVGEAVEIPGPIALGRT